MAIILQYTHIPSRYIVDLRLTQLSANYVSVKLEKQQCPAGVAGKCPCPSLSIAPRALRATCSPGPLPRVPCTAQSSRPQAWRRPSLASAALSSLLSPCLLAAADNPCSRAFLHTVSQNTVAQTLLPLRPGSDRTIPACFFSSVHVAQRLTRKMKVSFWEGGHGLSQQRTNLQNHTSKV